MDILCHSLFLVLLSLGISFYLLSKGPGSPAGHAGIFGAIAAFIALFAANFWPALLLTLNIALFPAVYFILANHAALKTALRESWKGKLSDAFEVKILVYLEKLESIQPQWLQRASDRSMIKMRLLQSSQSDAQSSKWQKRILAYGIKKAGLDEVDFSPENLNPSAVIATRIHQALSDAVEPSSLGLWLAVLSQIILGILAWILGHRV